MNNEKFLMNRLATSKNPFQGKTKKVLCVCSAGLLRSPTAAVVLSQEPFNFNTRAVGLEKEFALIPVDGVLLEWADEVVCMSNSQAQQLSAMSPDGKRIVSLNIPDNYEYRDPDLMNAIKLRYLETCNVPTPDDPDVVVNIPAHTEHSEIMREITGHSGVE